MQQKWINVQGLFTLGALLGASLPAFAGQYSQMVVFGDSLSDTGNLFALSGGLFPPQNEYYQGRFSNGPLWVEDLAPQLGLTYNQATNYALAGAGSGNDHVIGFLPGMQQQVSAFTIANPVADPNALYVVWAGANDYLAIGHTDPTVPPINIGTAVTNLAAHGAKHFLVPNLPDLGALPSTRNTAGSAAATLLSTQHNLLLNTELNTLRGQLPQADITLLNTAALFSQALANPAQFGLTNVTDSAFDTGAANPDNYLFWDDVHPTARGHQLIAQYAYAALVPEPGMTAFALGLAAVGGIALRRRVRKVD